MTQTWIWQSLHEERFIDFSVWLLYREDVRLFIVVEERDTQTHTLGVTNSNVSLLYCIVLWHIMQRLPDRELEWLWLKCILCFPRLCLSIELQLFLFFFFFFSKGYDVSAKCVLQCEAWHCSDSAAIFPLLFQNKLPAAWHQRAQCAPGPSALLPLWALQVGRCCKRVVFFKNYMFVKLCEISSIFYLQQLILAFNKGPFTLTCNLVFSTFYSGENTDE